LWAWHESNWWLLLGIAISRIATKIGVRSLMWTKGAGTFLGGFLLVGCAILGVFAGVHNYYTFFTFCTLWGYTLFRLAEKSQNQNALQSLVESSALFHEAIAQNKIMIVRK
jgi:hypothetical protein